MGINSITIPAGLMQKGDVWQGKTVKFTEEDKALLYVQFTDGTDRLFFTAETVEVKR